MILVYYLIHLGNSVTPTPPPVNTPSKAPACHLVLVLSSAPTSKVSPSRLLQGSSLQSGSLAPSRPLKPALPAFTLLYPFDLFHQVTAPLFLSLPTPLNSHLLYYLHITYLSISPSYPDWALSTLGKILAET